MPDGTANPYSQRILRVLLHVQNHLDDALSLEELAAVANISPFHFHRIFRGMVGEPVLAHVRRLRLERAAQHLGSTDRTVARIAFDAGYETHEAFTRAFRSLFEVSPSEYRRRQFTARPVSPSGVHLLARDEEINFIPLTEGTGTMNVVLVQREPMRLAFVRHIGPYEQVGAAWNTLFAWAGRKGLLKGRPMMFGLSHDDPDVTGANRLRYDACIAAGTDMEGEGEVAIQTLPGGTYAKFRHSGLYEDFSRSYAAFFDQWLPSSGYEAVDQAALEMYLNDPTHTPPEKLETDIFIALKRAEG